MQTLANLKDIYVLLCCQQAFAKVCKLCQCIKDIIFPIGTLRQIQNPVARQGNCSPTSKKQRFKDYIAEFSHIRILLWHIETPKMSASMQSHPQWVNPMTFCFLRCDKTMKTRYLYGSEVVAKQVFAMLSQQCMILTFQIVVPVELSQGFWEDENIIASLFVCSFSVTDWPVHYVFFILSTVR